MNQNPPNSRLDLTLVGTLIIASSLTHAFAPPRPVSRTRLTPIGVRNPFEEGTATGLSKVLENTFRDGSLTKERQDKSQSTAYIDQRGGMPDLVDWLSPPVDTQAPDSETNSSALVAIGIASLVLLLGVAGQLGLSLTPLGETIESAQRFLADPTHALEDVVRTVEGMGPLGALYFGAVYTVAEVLAVPAFPLTASAGYLFGLVQGTSIVLVSASIAAAISFIIGRTLLRSYVERLLEDYPEFQKIDNAIGKEGFKLMLLLRLSPVFPFALSNYLYGASSVGFWPFFWGTLLGFAPGTMAYVYTGEVGKALALGGGDVQPWYVYVGGLVVLTGFLKVLADVATRIIEEIDETA